MQFQLSPNNRDQPDEVLLEDLRTASAALGGRKLTRESYAKVGRFAPATIANRFDGWGKALIRAGLNPPRHFNVPPEDVIADLKRVASSLGVRTLSWKTYSRHGRYSEKPILRSFGSWVKALRASGLRVSEHYHTRATNEALFENLEKVWRELGRQPTVGDMVSPLSAYSAHTYKRRYGGFRKALEAFVAALAESVNEEPTNHQPAIPSPGPIPPEPAPVVRRGSTSPRAPGWRLQHMVMRRDNFRCCHCGRSPATHPGTFLEVDHIVPWSKGGQTVYSNLQTLCRQCNGGKGAD
jgi:hypothetical protein